MFTLSQGPLTVQVLDPKADHAKLGSRYCVGGYIWQVLHDQFGPLLSGPKYPDHPTGFDGQGLPEVFEIALGQHQTPVGGEVTVIGVGKVPRESQVMPFHVRNNFSVNEFAHRQIESIANGLRFETKQSHGKQALMLRKTVVLNPGVLESTSRVFNEGEEPIALRWFAHPFFPLAGSKACKVSVETFMPENPFYSIDSDGWIQRNLTANWVKGFFQPLTCAFGYPITLENTHPQLGSIFIECDFPVAHLPIWANDRTFSFEPYFHTILYPKQSCEWSIRYSFSLS